MGGFGEKNRGAPEAQDLRQASYVVAVFVRDDDAVEPLDSMAQRFEPPQRFALAQPRVHQHARSLGFDERQVA